MGSMNKKESVDYMDDDNYTYDDYIDYDLCDECQIYGDDYSFDEDGGIICNCLNCQFYKHKEDCNE